MPTATLAEKVSIWAAIRRKGRRVKVNEFHTVWAQRRPWRVLTFAIVTLPMIDLQRRFS